MNNPNSIPKIIHLLCKTSEIPSRYEEYVRLMFNLHPDWKFYLYNDEQMEQIVKSEFSELLTIYRAYTCNIQRVDFFRIIIMYMVGGFYMDLDICCLKSLDPLCEYSLVLGEEKTLTAEQCKLLSLNHSLRIANYMFGSRPEHPFWLDVLKGMVTKCDVQIFNENDVLETTGPGLITNIYHEKKGEYPEIVLLRNKGRKCLSKWCSDVSCHFGEYATHFHLGSWRWEYNKNAEPTAGKRISSVGKAKALKRINTMINNKNILECLSLR